MAQWVIFSAWMFYYAIMLYFGPNIFKTHASEVELKTALSDFVELDLSLRDVFDSEPGYLQMTHIEPWSWGKSVERIKIVWVLLSCLGGY